MPPITQALIIVNVVIFLLQMAGMGGSLLAWFALWPPGGSEYGPNAPQFQVWQLVSYSFLHGSVMHLLFNMFALYMFGSDLERLFGPRFFLGYYFASVLAAALCHLLVTGLMGAPAVPTVGASGGVFGLLLGFGWYFPRRTVVLIIPPIPMPARVFVALYGALELFLGVSGYGQGVAHFAHLGGMLGGLLMILYRKHGVPFARRRR